MATAEAIKRDLDKKVKKDISILATFIGAFCEENHGEKEKKVFSSERYFPDGGPNLCDDCARLLGYAIGKRAACPYDPKPACRKCPTHCYRKEYREKMQEVMRFSGPHLIKRGRLDLLLHYLK
jgi:hypothetical protein